MNNVPLDPQASADGLSAAEAARRAARDGANELPGSGPRSVAAITLSVLAEPMFLLLIAAAAIYLVLGEAREAIILSASVVLVIIITVSQERRTENSLARLRDLSSPRALVVRDGVEQRIAGRDVVIGDIVLLQEGDRVPADASVRSAIGLSVDESIITGESLPVDKETSAQIFSGSLIARGHGVAVVTAIGAKTEIGKIGHSLATLKVEVTPLFREVRRIVRYVAIGGLMLCVAIALLYGWSRHDWLGGALAGITLAMGVLPEEFPVVLTIFLAMGAWRISRQGVLTRRMPAIESIGAVTVLAVDKTGTLTENRMRVALLEQLDHSFVDLRSNHTDLPEDARAVLATALAASERQAFDPMEQAIHEIAPQLIAEDLSRLATLTLIREYDLTPELLAVTHVWRKDNEPFTNVAVKGAPETIFDLCKLDTTTRTALLARVAIHARDGLRVLAVASGQHAADALPETPHGFQLQLLGLLCLADPIRAEVPGSLAECVQAGIRVVMITGDHPGTALAIAKQAGFDTSGGAVTGDELTALSENELAERIKQVNIYARTRPEQKLRLVQAFKAQHEVIAMTGDGVNDAPALKAADIGVAMGSRGTDVAREAASLILINDDFKSLVNAVRLGRRIYDNIRHAMGFIVAVHIPIAAMGLLPVLFGWPLLFFPIHVLFLEFIIDPACAFVFEADEAAANVMQRKPRAVSAKLFSRPLLGRSISLGLVATLYVALVYWFFLSQGSEQQARTLGFVALVAANLTLIFAHRSSTDKWRVILLRPNPIFWWIASATVGVLACAIYIPAVADVFKFSPPPVIILLATAGLSLTVILAASCLQSMVGRKFKT